MTTNQSDRIIIALTGESGVGKSTISYTLQCEGFTELTFAAPLKAFALSIGFEHNEIYGTQEQRLIINKFWGITGREFMQKFGSEVCRDQLPLCIPNMQMNGYTLWIRALAKSMQNHKLIVVSDCRFPDEAAFIKEQGGFIIRIDRDLEESKKAPKHKSETEMSKIVPDLIFNNNGELHDLNDKVLLLIEQIKQIKQIAITDTQISEVQV